MTQPLRLAHAALTWSYLGFVNGEGARRAHAAAAGLSTNLSSGSPVEGSPYAITITNGTLSASNYVFTFNGGTFTVLPAALDRERRQQDQHLWLDDAGADRFDGWRYERRFPIGFVHYRRDPGQQCRRLRHPAFVQYPTLLANYTVTTNIGTLTITPAPLLVTADNQSRAYGYTNPAADPDLQRICPRR